jgi:hypothetical protein
LTPCIVEDHSENSNLAEFAQMRQKRMGIGAIKTSFGGIGPMCQKGTDTVGELTQPGLLRRR